MTSMLHTRSTWRRRLPYGVAALALVASVLMPILSGEPAGALVIEEEIRLSPGEVYVNEDHTIAPYGPNLGLSPDDCLTGNLTNPQAEVACHVYKVVIEGPREQIVAGELQLNILIEYPTPTQLPNCPAGLILTRVSCASHTMAAEAWTYPATQILEPGRNIIIDLPVIGYIQYPDDGTVPGGCDTIDGTPKHPPLPGQPYGSTLTCTAGAGLVSDTWAAGSTDTFGNEDPPISLAVVAAGRCPVRYQEEDEEILAYLEQAQGYCPNIDVNLASVIGTNPYRITMEVVKTGVLPPDLSFDPDFGFGIPPDDGFGIPEQALPPLGASSDTGFLVPGIAPPLPGSSLPGFGAPDGALSGIGTGTVIGNDDLAAAIINRGAKPLPPAGDPSTVWMLMWMVFLPVGGLGTLLFVVFRRRRRDDALVAGAGSAAIA